MVRELEIGHAHLLEGPNRAPGRSNIAKSSLAWLIGGLASVAACLVAMILVLVFAATLAVVVVLAAAFMATGALAWRLRRGRAPSTPLLEARKIGHSWITYGWDQQL